MIAVRDRPLTIFAPGSIAPVRDALRQGFASIAPTTALRFHPPAYSGLLAAEIQQGAPADVFISANPRYMADLHRRGLVPRPAILARNALCLVVRAGAAGEVSHPRDVLQPGRRLLIPPAAHDPLGEYIEAMLANQGYADLLAAKRSRGEVVETLASAAALFADGTLDAAFVYCTSAPALAPAAIVVPLSTDAAWSDHITFTVGVVGHSAWVHPAGAAFVDYLLDPAGQAVLLAGGFLPSPRLATWPNWIGDVR
ncbi:MAG: molybdate ABC transporter substrate-binding protein [Chloroflexota bacterium]|nr:molybdate ABC transporter substrate-binding protein [Chloroflexota bacterium]